MGIMEAEMQRLLGWVNPEKLAAAQAIKDDQDRHRALSEMVRWYNQARLDDERATYVRSCVGEKVWIHLPGDERMNLYQGVVVSLEVDEDGGLVAKLKDPHYSELIEFDPTQTMPHFYRKRKTDGGAKRTVDGVASENVRDDTT